MEIIPLNFQHANTNLVVELVGSSESLNAQFLAGGTGRAMRGDCSFAADKGDEHRRSEFVERAQARQRRSFERSKVISLSIKRL